MKKINNYEYLFKLFPKDRNFLAVIKNPFYLEFTSLTKLVLAFSGKQKKKEKRFIS